MSVSSQNLILPFLGPLYRALSPLAELLLRVAIGGFLIPHGLQKAFGAFGGPGFGGTAGFLAGLGMTPGWLWATVAIIVEIGCGALILIGFLTRPAAAIAFVFLLVATVSVHLQNGFFASSGGYEFALMWAIGALFFAVRGAGPISVDRMLGREF
ncbi:DoxX family protein [Microbaculum marinum]|uniref:DoxX family protein n=1 Tax=Microbaculum marinum TaxID=1764581 RepID=A0AAW9RLU4_9HYPH